MDIKIIMVHNLKILMKFNEYWLTKNINLIYGTWNIIINIFYLMTNFLHVILNAILQNFLLPLQVT